MSLPYVEAHTVEGCAVILLTDGVFPASLLRVVVEFETPRRMVVWRVPLVGAAAGGGPTLPLFVGYWGRAGRGPVQTSELRRWGRLGDVSLVDLHLRVARSLDALEARSLRTP